MGRVEVSLDQDVHDKWSEHVEDGSRYKTITQLIRFAVSEQIDRDNGEKSDGGDINPEAIEDAVRDPIQVLENDMRSMRNDIVQTQRVMESLTDEDEHLNNAMELHDLLPRVSSIEKALEGSTTGYVSDLADQFRDKHHSDISDSKIQIALARLENDVPQVASRIVEGERVYYEEVSE
jgi:Arc/MetJ-type ribon-helix-helix transcriptional regulator